MVKGFMMDNTRHDENTLPLHAQDTPDTQEYVKPRLEPLPNYDAVTELPIGTLS